MQNDNIRLSVGQMRSQTGSVERNLSAVEVLVKRAASHGSRLLVLPELCITGYRLDNDFPRFSQTLGGSYISELRRMSQESGGIWLYTTIPETSENGGKPYNTGVLVAPDGLVASYRKLHLWGTESVYFQAGIRMTQANTPCGKAGLHICFDISFPESARCSALAGAELLMYSFAFSNPDRAYCFDILTRSRALENGCYLAAANMTGMEKDTAFFGCSRIVDPAGRVLAALGQEEGVATAEISLPELERIRKRYPYLTSRRPALYTTESYVR